MKRFWEIMVPIMFLVTGAMFYRWFSMPILKAANPEGTKVATLMALGEKDKAQVIGSVDACKIVRVYDFAGRYYFALCPTNVHAVPLVEAVDR